MTVKINKKVIIVFNLHTVNTMFGLFNSSYQKDCKELKEGLKKNRLHQHDLLVTRLQNTNRVLDSVRGELFFGDPDNKICLRQLKRAQESLEYGEVWLEGLVKNKKLPDTCFKNTIGVLNSVSQQLESDNPDKNFVLGQLQAAYDSINYCGEWVKQLKKKS